MIRHNPHDTAPVDSATLAVRRDPRARSYRLVARLQTTLEPDRQLRHFFDELAGVLNLRGLRCRFDSVAPVELGEDGRCFLIYSLVVGNDWLGELTVSRDSAFSADETELLERGIDLLVMPLRNALRYQQALAAAESPAARVAAAYALV